MEAEFGNIIIASIGKIADVGIAIGKSFCWNWYSGRSSGVVGAWT